MTEEEQIAYAMQVCNWGAVFGDHIRTKAESIIATVSTLFDPPVQMSMAENEGDGGGSEEKMDVDDKDQDYSEVIKVSFHLTTQGVGLTLIVNQFQVMNDPEFLQSVLQVVKTEFFPANL